MTKTEYKKMEKLMHEAIRKAEGVFIYFRRIRIRDRFF
jgi:hypothetical protein